MNKYKVFIETNLLWHLCLLFLGFPLMSNLFGFIPILIYSAIITNIIKKEESYLKKLFKCFLVFLSISLILCIESFFIVGILMSIFGIVIALLLNPIIINRE